MATLSNPATASIPDPVFLHTDDEKHSLRKAIHRYIEDYTKTTYASTDPSCQALQTTFRVSRDRPYKYKNGAEPEEIGSVSIVYLWKGRNSTWSEPYGTSSNYKAYYEQLLTQLASAFPNVYFHHTTDGDGGYQCDVIEISYLAFPETKKGRKGEEGGKNNSDSSSCSSCSSDE